MGDCLRNSGPENECRLSAKAKVGLREFVGFLGFSAKGRYVSGADIQIEGLQWSGIYFGNAAEADDHDGQQYGSPNRPTLAVQKSMRFRHYDEWMGLSTPRV